MSPSREGFDANEGAGAAGLTFSNPKVQRLRRLLGRRSARSEEGVVVVAGESLLAQAVAAGWSVEAQFVAPGASPVECDAPVHYLAPNVIERVATTDTPRPVIAVLRRLDRVLPQQPTFLVLCEHLSDPGNAGTIIRSAEAAGADGVVFTPGSVDPFGPKVVRSSAGSVFRVPVVVGALDAVRETGVRLLATSSHRGTVYSDADLVGPVALVVGNEAHGLPDDVAVDEWVTIPHHGPTESLNVAMATTVLAFEVARQRRGR
ncbi:MAG: TrmH family RNA methyltransferase [Ilumatobacteraceae bacterium]